MGSRNKLNEAAHWAGENPMPSLGPTLLTTPPTWGLESLGGRIERTAKTLSSSYRKSNPNPHQPQTHDWGFATGALYKVDYGGPWDGFEYPKPKPLLRGMRRSWGIEGRNDLLGTIYWLLTDGHRHEFHSEVSLVASLDRQQYASLEANLAETRGVDPELRWRLSQARANTYGVRSVEFAPWDHVRAIMLSTVGTFLGFISRDECLDVYAIAQAELQSRYRDWLSLGRDYAIGRWFWSGGKEQRLVESLAAVNVMLDEGGPWRIVPYNLPQPRIDGSILRAIASSGVVAPLTADEREDANPWKLHVDDLVRASGGGFGPPTVTNQ